MYQYCKTNRYTFMKILNIYLPYLCLVSPPLCYYKTLWWTSWCLYFSAVFWLFLGDTFVKVKWIDERYEHFLRFWCIWPNCPPESPEPACTPLGWVRVPDCSHPCQTKRNESNICKSDKIKMVLHCYFNLHLFATEI